MNEVGNLNPGLIVRLILALRNLKLQLPPYAVSDFPSNSEKPTEMRTASQNEETQIDTRRLAVFDHVRAEMHAEHTRCPRSAAFGNTYVPKSVVPCFESVEAALIRQPASHQR